MLEQFPREVEVVIKNFPLGMHKMAEPAAIASLAANRQGNFWDYQKKLFENQKDLSEQKFVEIATEIKMDPARFQADIKDPALQEAVKKDLQDGISATVRGTPTIFVNGRLLKNRSIQGFREIIEKQIKQTQEAKQTPAGPVVQGEAKK